MNKDLIKERFAKSLASYNEHAGIQKKMAERLCRYTDKKHYQHILEIGCGTGFLTELLNKKLSFETYTAIDIVGGCSIYISEINPNIEFIQDDIESYIKKDLKNYDLITSNAALQWVEDFFTTVSNLKNKLTQNGELIISTFGKDNFKEIFQTTGTTLNYHSVPEIQKQFPQGEISSEIYKIGFKTPIEVLKHLQLTGVNAVENRVWTKKDLLNFEQDYNKICSFGPELTYNPIYIKILNNLK